MKCWFGGCDSSCEVERRDAKWVSLREWGGNGLDGEGASLLWKMHARRVDGTLLPSVFVDYWFRRVEPVGQCLAQGHEGSVHQADRLISNIVRWLLYIETLVGDFTARLFLHDSEQQR